MDVWKIIAARGWTPETDPSNGRPLFAESSDDLCDVSETQC